MEPSPKRRRQDDGEVLRTRRPHKLDADLIRYFRQLEVTLVEFEADDASGDAADRSEMLVHAALREMRNSEASAASHKHCSHVVERLLTIASGLALRTFMHNAAGFALHMCTNRYASHVVQVMLKRAATLLYAPQQRLDEAEDAPPPIAELIASFCGEIEQDWATIISDPSGSHTARSLLDLLSGGGAPTAATPMPIGASAQLGGIVPAICATLLELGWGTLRKAASTHHSGGAIALLVEALSSHQRQLRSLRVNLLSDGTATEGETLVKLASCGSGSRVLESIVRVSSGKGGCDSELFEIFAERQGAQNIYSLIYIAYCH